MRNPHPTWISNNSHPITIRSASVKIYAIRRFKLNLRSNLTSLSFLASVTSCFQFWRNDRKQVTPFSPYPPTDSKLPVVKQEMFDVDGRFSSNLDVWGDGGGPEENINYSLLQWENMRRKFRGDYEALKRSQGKIELMLTYYSRCFCLFLAEDFIKLIRKVRLIAIWVTSRCFWTLPRALLNWNFLYKHLVPHIWKMYVILWIIQKKNWKPLPVSNNFGKE